MTLQEYFPLSRKGFLGEDDDEKKDTSYTCFSVLVENHRKQSTQIYRLRTGNIWNNFILKYFQSIDKKDVVLNESFGTGWRVSRTDGKGSTKGSKSKLILGL